MLGIIFAILVFAAGDGNIRIWKDYTVKGKQKLVTAFSSIQGHKPGVRSLNAVVDWQQQSGYLVHTHLSLSLVLFLYS
jgi:regulator-associated protein of mTOR